MDEFSASGTLQFDSQVFASYSQGFLANSVTDEQTLALIKEIYTEEGYLLDPHAAVGLSASDTLREQLGTEKLVVLATAHPAKFPETIRRALNSDELPLAATHHSIESAKNYSQKVHLCEYQVLEPALIHAMQSNWELTKGQ